MAEEVKVGTGTPERRGISRHLEGWQPALLAVVIAALAALLGAPRAVEPDILPLPAVDWRESARADDAARAAAREALAAPLPFEVRAVGEAFRRFGSANAAHDSGLATDRLLELRGLAQGAISKHGDDALLKLQALQSEMFLALLERWEDGDDGASVELAELGGNFVQKARGSGWLAAPRHFVGTPSERRVLFKARWADVTGLRGRAALAPTANEWRIYYRFLLLHPELDGGGPPARQQLRYVSIVEKVDLDYPGAFARGVLHFRAGDYVKAQTAFQSFLEGNPDGPWRLRARNHLVAAIERAKTETSDPFAE